MGGKISSSIYQMCCFANREAKENTDLANPVGIFTKNIAFKL
jgi:hypothetical protein